MANNYHTPSRRAVLMGSASFSVLAGVPAVAIAAAPADPDAELHRRIAEWRRRAAEHADICGGADAVQEAVDAARPELRAARTAASQAGDHDAWRIAVGRWLAALEEFGIREAEAATEAAIDREVAALKAVADCPAVTPRGLALKARIAFERDDIDPAGVWASPGDSCERMLAALLGDLERMALPQWRGRAV